MAGLRREEIALLAGVSADYYARLEQGRAANVSDQVVGAVAEALRLDDLERRHLAVLLKPARDASTDQQPGIRPALRSMIAALDPVPAILNSPRLDVLAINRAGSRLIDDFAAMAPPERNIVRWMFLNPKARSVYLDWADIATQLVASLRVAGGRDPDDHRLAALVDELSTRSTEFASFWAEHRIFQHTYGPKRFHHEAVGTMTLNYETMYLPADAGLSLVLYTADPGSPSAEKLARMAES